MQYDYNNDNNKYNPTQHTINIEYKINDIVLKTSYNGSVSNIIYKHRLSIRILNIQIR